jgi:hypothetical protein
MDPKVRELYKRFLYASRNYPSGSNALMQRVKKEFFANRQLTNEIEIKKAIARGRYLAREVVAVNQLHKYRHLKKSYYDE